MRIAGRRGGIVLQVLSLVLFVALWQTLVYFRAYRFSYIPSVPDVLDAAQAYLLSMQFVSDATASTARVLAAWGLSALIGVPLGLMIGWRRAFRNLTFPMVELLRPIPPIAWIPAGILFFPNTESGVIFICFVGCFFPIVLNTISGVQQIDQTYFRAAHCLGAAERRIFYDVVVRGAMPSVIVGLAVGMGINWMALVAAEMIAGQHGLGYMIWQSYSLAQYPLIIVGMVVIGGIGAGMSAGIRYLGRKLVPWQRT
jgi:NitT/TauT family transport system permease protein